MSLTLRFLAPCAPISSNDRRNRYMTAGLTKQWRARAHVEAIRAGKPKLDHAHITATIHPTTNRRRDVLNLWPTVKAAIDGIVDAGVLPDDDDRHVVGPDLRPGAKTTVFTLSITLNDQCACGECAARFGDSA